MTLDDWIKVATIGGAFGGAAFVYGVGKFVWKGLTNDIFKKIDQVRHDFITEAKLLKKEVVFLAREQSEIKIEQRRNKLRSEALSDVMQESLLTPVIQKRLRSQFRDIDETVDGELQQSDQNYQNKIEDIEKEIKKNGGD